MSDDEHKPESWVLLMELRLTLFQIQFWSIFGSNGSFSARIGPILTKNGPISAKIGSFFKTIWLFSIEIYKFLGIYQNWIISCSMDFHWLIQLMILTKKVVQVHFYDRKISCPKTNNVRQFLKTLFGQCWLQCFVSSLQQHCNVPK